MGERAGTVSAKLQTTLQPGPLIGPVHRVMVHVLRQPRPVAAIGAGAVGDFVAPDYEVARPRRHSDRLGREVDGARIRAVQARDPAIGQAMVEPRHDLQRALMLKGNPPIVSAPHE
mgnify:CR=1 FL=1